jgi:hypothetical protein
MNSTFKAFALAASLLVASKATAVVVNYNDTLLGNGSFSWLQGGVTLDLTAAAGGTLFSIGSGQFAGAWIANNVSSTGVYTLTLSQPVTFFELEFDALSSTGNPPPEVISNIATNPAGATLAYLDQGGTSFNGTTITSTANDGQGTITLTSATPFTTVSFMHTQNVSQNGFVIERVTINTDVVVGVPDAGSSLVALGMGLLTLAALRRRR